MNYSNSQRAGVILYLAASLFGGYDKVATLHVPYKKTLITSALKDPDFKVQTMTEAGQYHYKLD